MKTRSWAIYFTAFLVGLWSIYQFAVPATWALDGFLRQGQVNLYASEISPDNPPLMPPVTVTEFLRDFIPSGLGVFNSICYAIVAFVSALRKRIYSSWTYLVTISDLCLRALHVNMSLPFLPLPSLSQNIIFGLMWAGPFVLCGIFSIFWLLWAKKHKTDQAHG